MNVASMHDVAYQATYSGSKTLDALVFLTGLQLDRLYYKPTQLNKMINLN